MSLGRTPCIFSQLPVAAVPCLPVYGESLGAGAMLHPYLSFCAKCLEHGKVLIKVYS